MRVSARRWSALCSSSPRDCAALRWIRSRIAAAESVGSSAHSSLVLSSRGLMHTRRPAAASRCSSVLSRRSKRATARLMTCRNCRTVVSSARAKAYACTWATTSAPRSVTASNPQRVREGDQSRLQRGEGGGQVCDQLGRGGQPQPGGARRDPQRAREFVADPRLVRAPWRRGRRRGGRDLVQQPLLARGQRSFLALQLEQRVDARLVLDLPRRQCVLFYPNTVRRPAKTPMK